MHYFSLSLSLSSLRFLIRISFGLQDPGFPSTIIEYILNISDVNRFICDELSKILPGIVAPVIDEQANELFANLTMDVSLLNGTVCPRLCSYST
jgi:hypothetical protein